MKLFVMPTNHYQTLPTHQSFCEARKALLTESFITFLLPIYGILLLLPLYNTRFHKVSPITKPLYHTDMHKLLL